MKTSSFVGVTLESKSDEPFIPALDPCHYSRESLTLEGLDSLRGLYQLGQELLEQNQTSLGTALMLRSGLEASGQSVTLPSLESLDDPAKPLGHRFHHALAMEGIFDAIKEYSRKKKEEADRNKEDAVKFVKDMKPILQANIRQMTEDLSRIKNSKKDVSDPVKLDGITGYFTSNDIFPQHLADVVSKGLKLARQDRENIVHVMMNTVEATCNFAKNMDLSSDEAFEKVLLSVIQQLQSNWFDKFFPVNLAHWYFGEFFTQMSSSNNPYLNDKEPIRWLCVAAEARRYVDVHQTPGSNAKLTQTFSKHDALSLAQTALEECQYYLNEALPQFTTLAELYDSRLINAQLELYYYEIGHDFRSNKSVTVGLEKYKYLLKQKELQDPACLAHFMWNNLYSPFRLMQRKMILALVHLVSRVARGF